MSRMWSCLLCLSGVLAAQGPPDQVTLEQATKEALEKNLGLLAEKYNVSIAEARMITARLRPNPVFSAGLDYQNVFGAPFAGDNNIGPSEYNFRTDFILERGGKRQSRIEVAEGARAVAQLQFLNSTRALVLDVQGAFVDVLLAKENLALARENLKSFTGIVEINSVRVRTGDLAQVELVRSRVAALQFQNVVRQAELRLRLASTRLQTLMGRTALSPTFDAIGDLRREGARPGVDDLRRQALELRPDYLALKRDQARSVADLRLQIAQGKVDYTVGTMFHRQYGSGTVAPGSAMGFFFSAPLPVFNRNQGEIERARREQQQIQARIKALEADIANQVQNAYQQFSTSRDLLESIEKDMLAQAREVRETTEYSYKRGEASFVEFLDAQRAFNDTIQSYNEARAEYARSLYLIDSISGKVVNP